MPVSTEKFTELGCQFPKEGLMTALIYNIALILVCTFFAFKTRKLPDNFNEAKFISACVYTTLIMWLSFLPAYEIIDRHRYKAFLMGLDMLLNHAVIIALIFLPKIYAVVYVNNEEFQTGQNQSINQSRLEYSNKVYPAGTSSTSGYKTNSDTGGGTTKVTDYAICDHGSSM